MPLSPKEHFCDCKKRVCLQQPPKPKVDFGKLEWFKEVSESERFKSFEKKSLSAWRMVHTSIRMALLFSTLHKGLS